MASDLGRAKSSNLLPILKDMGFNEQRIEMCLKVLFSNANGDSFPVTLEAAVEW